jgi:hypothetical protein
LISRGGSWITKKITAEWVKPEAEQRGYICIGRHDPVEYSPENKGWIFLG